VSEVKADFRRDTRDLICFRLQGSVNAGFVDGFATFITVGG